MCRALLYLGEPVLLDNLLYQPDSALVRQSYMPKMLHMMNLAGFGMRAWDRQSRTPDKPWAYGSTELPVFDRNLKNLAEKVEASAVLAHVRGVAYSTAVEISPANVHPFQFPGSPLAMAHNGDLARFADLKPALATHLPPALARHIRGTTDSEWIYALVLSGLRDPGAVPEGGELVEAIGRALAIIRRERERLGIDLSSSVNLFFADGTQVAAVRYCFDFGRYATEDAARIHEANLNFLSLWYTLGRDYGLHDGEWKMTGGAEAATSILVASEPLTRDVASWVEVPEYSVLHARIRDGRPGVTVSYID
ncbi:MAG TPA: class II glutamine amidotransferase [Usitatibacteraceae bacterium]|nr:class II glutamine amidotransferase [Usitatibacteraceae bacterium]